MPTPFPLVTTDILAALLRVAVGAAFVMHGLPKLKGGWRQAGQWIQSMGVPPGAAVVVTILEFFGGILLIIGLLVPVVAAFFVIEMAAIVIVKRMKMHASIVSMLPDKPSYEIDATYLLLSLTLFVLGAGVLSLDGLLGI